MDADGSGYGSSVVQDEPISFNQAKREYGFRRVVGKMPLELTINQLADTSTQHDAFAEVEA